jgi:hypothetical protein
MTCDDIALLADEYVDGTCDQGTIAAIGDHLDGCAECRALAGDLSRLRSAAKTLGPIAPPAHVWANIEARLHGDAASASRGGWRGLLAAAAAFALLAAGLSWLGTHLPPAASPVEGAALAPGDQFQLAEAVYQSAIEDLESITAQADAPVLAEPAFAALQAGLVDLDAAIDEARGRLSAAPDDELTQENLLTALDSKVLLLRDTVALLDQNGAYFEEPNP